MDTNKDKISKITNYIKERILYNKTKKEQSYQGFNQSSANNSLNKEWNFNISELEKNVQDNNGNWNIETPQRITSHRKIVGRFIVWGKKIFRKFLSWYVDPVVEQQRYFNASSTRSINELYKFILDIMPIIKNMQEKINNTQDTIFNLNKKLDDLISLEKKKEELFESKINNLEKYILDIEKDLRDTMGKVNDRISKYKYHFDLAINDIREEVNYSKKLDEYKEEINSLLLEVNQNGKLSDELKMKINEIDNKISIIEQIVYFNKLLMMNLLQNETCKKKEKQDEKNSLFNYLDFENTFRGSEELIKERFEFYLKYFKDKKNVLDIGCGRGEMLELLKENDINALGIDINEDMVSYCRSKGLKVEKADAIEYLREIEDNSLDGIFIGQVVEHLDFNYLLQLLKLTYQKLSKEGILIIEAPNPMCLYIYSFGFYIDPTHIKPVHPYTVKYILDKVNFRDIEIKLLSPVPENTKLSLINIENINDKYIALINENFKKINDILFSYQDYAIIARK
ncbi:class I SAM-dependent methyltransferase [Thermohalobacter berrensis]|uniref:Methyltransferase type 11 domain-containing protein n=1 Tax=Thermohalobacter berrensis TaxID=99594 RepID=A0A419T481_9FIRM|nr:class I SAM-dependent methyltransferase [Thermohalobacter berrensis]RKD32271.1 hypothetical protein BET03_02870 [Thermohalobacter berrensis]